MYHKTCCDEQPCLRSSLTVHTGLLILDNMMGTHCRGLVILQNAISVILKLDKKCLHEDGVGSDCPGSKLSGRL